MTINISYKPATQIKQGDLVCEADGSFFEVESATTAGRSVVLTFKNSGTYILAPRTAKVSKRSSVRVVLPPPRDAATVRAIILANAQDPTRGTYEGLSTEEIAAYSRRLMFGESDEAFPSQREWSQIVD